MTIVYQCLSSSSLSKWPWPEVVGAAVRAPARLADAGRRTRTPFTRPKCSQRHFNSLLNHGFWACLIGRRSYQSDSSFEELSTPGETPEVFDRPTEQSNLYIPYYRWLSHLLTYKNQLKFILKLNYEALDSCHSWFSSDSSYWCSTQGIFGNDPSHN